MDGGVGLAESRWLSHRGRAIQISSAVSGSSYTAHQPALTGVTARPWCSAVMWPLWCTDIISMLCQPVLLNSFVYVRSAASCCPTIRWALKHLITFTIQNKGCKDSPSDCWGSLRKPILVVVVAWGFAGKNKTPKALLEKAGGEFVPHRPLVVSP